MKQKKLLNVLVFGGKVVKDFGATTLRMTTFDITALSIPIEISMISRGTRYQKGENLEVVWAEFSTVS